MIRTKFYVRSDVDDNNIRADFSNSVDAISYAAGFSPMDKCYVVEATVDVDEESGEVLRELESEKIWSFEDLPTEDAFGVDDWPDVGIKDEEEMKLDTDFDVKDIHETLEAREDLVECQHCFDLFPKEECTKIEYGYLCPHCHSIVVKEVEFPNEMVDDATFCLEFPEPYDFEDDGDEDEIEEKSFQELVTDPTNSDISVDPETGNEIITGDTMMKAFEQGINAETGEVAQPGELEAAPEVSIETPATFAEIPVTIEGAELNDGSSDDSSDDSDGILDEHVQDRPAPIEDETKLQGVDNAVVDCKTYTLAAHCEDEKPVDCKMEKPALKEPLAGEKVDIKLTEENKVLTKFVQDKMANGEDIETITNSEEFKELTKEEGKKDLGITEDLEKELVAYAASLPEDLNEETDEILDEGIFGIITAKDIDSKFSYDGYYVIGRNKDGSEKEKKDFNNFKDAKNYALNFSKLSNNGTGSVIAKDHGKNTALVAFDAGKEVLNTIKDVFKDIKAEDKEAKKDAKAMKDMAKADEKGAEIKAEEEPKAEEKSTEEPKAKRDMSKQNKARADYKKLTKALQILKVDPKVLRTEDGKVTPEFKELRKVLFTESYPDMPFDSDAKEGNKIKIIHLEGEDSSYDGVEGIIERIDSIGQLHGTWGDLAVIPGVDSFEIITEELVEAKKDEEEVISPEEAKLEAHTMLNQLVADEIEAINGYDESKLELADKPLEHKEEIIHTIDHIKAEEKEHIDELINATKKIPFEHPAVEELEEASSAEKKAFKDGGEAASDYIQGKAIARIKDPAARDAAIAAVKAGRPEVAKDFYGQRKEDQADATFDKKQTKMQAAGMVAEDLHKNEEAIVAEWARQGVETGMIFDEGDYDQFAKICKIEGIKPSEDLFKHYFKCIDDLVSVKEVEEESLEFTCDQDLADDRTPTPTPEGELGEPIDGDQVRKHEHAIKEATDEVDICAWCGEEHPKSELHNEVDLGYLCDTCEQAIKSRGEKLTFEE